MSNQFQVFREYVDISTVKSNAIMFAFGSCVKINVVTSKIAKGKLQTKKLVWFVP